MDAANNSSRTPNPQWVRSISDCVEIAEMHTQDAEKYIRQGQYHNAQVRIAMVKEVMQAAEAIRADGRPNAYWNTEEECVVVWRGWIHG